MTLTKPYSAPGKYTPSRSRIRSVPEPQALADAFDAPQPPAAGRLRYAFGCEFPYRLALRRELGEQLLSMGLVGEAASPNWKTVAAVRAGCLSFCTQSYSCSRTCC